MLAAHKDRLCAHLMERYRDWFGVAFEFLLYDVTSTFFEGKAEGNEKAARGYSRDQRSDCKQVCIGGSPTHRPPYSLPPPRWSARRRGCRSRLKSSRAIART